MSNAIRGLAILYSCWRARGMGWAWRWQLPAFWRGWFLTDTTVEAMIHEVPCVAHLGVRRVGRPLCSGVGERGAPTPWPALAHLLVSPAPNDTTGQLDEAIQTPGAPDLLRSVPRSLWRGGFSLKYRCVQNLAEDVFKLGAALLKFLLKELLEVLTILGNLGGGEGIRKKGILIKQRDGDGVEPWPVVRPQISAVAKSDLGKRLSAPILDFRVARRRE